MTPLKRVQLIGEVGVFAACSRHALHDEPNRSGGGRLITQPVNSQPYEASLSETRLAARAGARALKIKTSSAYPVLP